MDRRISRSNDNICEENLHKFFLECQFADTWRSRSVAADGIDEGESVGVLGENQNQLRDGIRCILMSLRKKPSSCSKEIIFKFFLDFQKEYNSLLLAEDQEKDDEWLDEVDHNVSVFKQRIHRRIKDAEMTRKESLFSRSSHVFGSFGR